MGIAHWDEVKRRSRALGHLQGTWTFLGEAAGCVGAGVRRIEVPAGGWSTPAHEHGREEEIFFVLAGRGLSWEDGETYEIGPGDCVVYPGGRVAHTLHALEDLDVLAFGPRLDDESVGFPRTGLSIVGARMVESTPGFYDGFPAQFHAEAAVGPPELPVQPSPRPATIVNLADVEPNRESRGQFAGPWRDLGRAAGSVRTGLKHVQVPAGMLSCPQHCHSAEEEIFVILGGEGVLWLGDDETPVRAGHVVSRPPGTRVAHAFRGGEPGLTYLAYGTRDPNDIVWYPRSQKIFWRGVGVIARVEPLDYWDGED
ncbi:MAG TPA: cupin domain-containing protein [Gaiellaceae bacterium]|nr:cupin domain-containing protein [Gaiellaceae bacterium]